MPGTWKLKKKKEEETPKAKHKEMHRTKSTKGSKNGHHQVTCPRRTATISGGVVAPDRVNSTESNDSTTSPDHFSSEGRQAKKRPTLSFVFDNSNDDSDASNASPSSNAFKIYFEDDTTSFETLGIGQEGVPLINVLEAAFYEQKKDCTRILDYMIISQDDATGDSCVADVHSPSTDYLGTTIQIVISQNNFVEDEIESPLSEVAMMSVQSCLNYFDTHGIITLPTNRCYDDSYRHPIVDKPIDPIESSWDNLPIEDVKNSLNSTQMSCQQAIWELIVTEHSFLKQLEIVINIYMRSLEFIRRQGLLTDVNYHNIFGYMEEIYKVHEQFWTSTLYPCLEKVRTEHCPLDVNDIIVRFPSQFSDDFEIYEQHCAFETTNLNSLDEAMNDADFRAYVKWCESQPECNRLRLKDFLAIPRQRLMKYQLLFQAILKKTPHNAIYYEELKHIIEDVSLFVDTVNSALKTQDETTRVQEVMKKIVGYAPVEIPGDLKEFVQPHTHLDLMAPMPDVDVTKIRLLVLEGKLRFRDQKDKMVVHVFLFSDMLLITKPVKGKTENYIILRPPYKISNIQVELKGDAVCCIVLNEFKVLSALFTLRANSAHIAKGWRDQIISTQDFYDSALTRTVPTIHILQSLRQERILHGVSQDFSLDPPDLKLVSTASPLLSAGTGFQRVNSNDSTLSSNSSTAFQFDGQTVSPRPGRRDTVPCHGFTESKRSFRRNSAHPCPSPLSSSTSLSFGITPPVWQRTSSLNSLPERKMSDSTHGASRSHLKLRQSNSVSDYNDVQRSNSDPQRADSFGELTESKASKQNDFIDACPMLVEKAAPLQESDSNTDDEEYVTSTSPINPPALSSNLDTTGITIRRHRRNKSQPNSMYMIDTSTPDLSRHNERDESMYTVPVKAGGEGKQLTEDSLMGEIIKELSKTDSGSSKKLQHDFEETYDSFDADVKVQRKRSMSLHSSISGLERRFNNRRRAIHQLDNIFETTDEDSDSKLQEISMDATYFARNTKLRRSKSSFELSFHRRLKPPSPLITHMQRSFEKECSEDYSHSHTKLSSHISTPILPSHRWKRKPKPVPEQAQATKGAKHKKEKKSPEKRRYRLSFFKKERSSSPTESKWGLKGLRRAMTMSVDSGLNHAGITPIDSPSSPLSPAATSISSSSSSSGKKGTRRNSSKIMVVVCSDNKK